MEINDATRYFAALAHPARLTIYRTLVNAGPGGLAVNQIGASVSLPPATLSFHLKELSQAGLIEGQPQSRFIIYRADIERMRALAGFLTDTCCGGNPAACALPNLAGAAA